MCLRLSSNNNLYTAQHRQVNQVVMITMKTIWSGDYDVYFGCKSAIETYIHMRNTEKNSATYASYLPLTTRSHRHSRKEGLYCGICILFVSLCLGDSFGSSIHCHIVSSKTEHTSTPQNQWITKIYIFWGSTIQCLVQFDRLYGFDSKKHRRFYHNNIQGRTVHLEHQNCFPYLLICIWQSCHPFGHSGNCPQTLHIRIILWTILILLNLFRLHILKSFFRVWQKSSCQ